MIADILQIALWLFVWLLLSWPPERIDIVLGVPVAIFVFVMTKDLLVRKPAPFRHPARYLWFIVYILLFIWECLKANIDVAYRVIHPDLPIRPGTIKVKTSLKSDAGLTFLANSITLTPGTTTVDIDRENGYIYIHWLYVKEGYDASSMRLAVVEKFERILQRILG
jgi:multicomponent Na+:H+ antiporter subunit E